MTSKADYQAAAKLLSDLAAAQPDDVVIPPPPPPPPPPVDIYANGTKYPARPIASIAPAQVLPGATKVHALITLSATSPLTVEGRIRCYNGVGGRARPDTTKWFTFRPGDPLQQTISFDIYPMIEGQTVTLEQPNLPTGAQRGSGATVLATASAVPQQPIPPAGRPPLAFSPTGNLVYDVTGKQLYESGLWLNQLVNGRTQPTTGETGYYHPDAFEVVGDDLLLKSYRLDTPIPVGDPPQMYQFASSALTGLQRLPAVSRWPQARPELCLRYGSIEWLARMPNRKGSWPALWLCSNRNGYAQWPFEIDVHEGLVEAYWNYQNSLSCALHGGREGSNVQTFAVGGTRLLASDLGIAPTLSSEFHKHQVTIEPEWITKFTDGVETMRFQNPFDGAERWYPLMTVAVKVPSSAPYADGDGNMGIRQMRIWRTN